MSAQELPLPPALLAESLVHRDHAEQHGRRSRSSSRAKLKVHGFRARIGLENVARRTLGIVLLLATVVLFTASNFLASVRLSSKNLVLALLN